MTKRLPWWKKYVSDWRAGTRGMSLEEKGFYGECLDAQWELQGELPLDDKRLAMMLDCNPRSVRKLMSRLVAAGKMIRTAKGYYNPRMMRDITGRELEPNSTPIQVEFEPKVPKKPLVSTRDLIPESTNQKERPPTPLRGPTPLEALDAFNGWNATALRCALPQAAKLTKGRQKLIIARLKEYGAAGWAQALANIERSGFLTGTNDRQWRADLDFLLQASSFSKVHDGAYGNGRHVTRVDIKPTAHQLEMDREIEQLKRAGVL